MRGPCVIERKAGFASALGLDSAVLHTFVRYQESKKLRIQVKAYDTASRSHMATTRPLMTVTNGMLPGDLQGVLRRR
jgi:hypothetical protein